MKKYLLSGGLLGAMSLLPLVALAQASSAGCGGPTGVVSGNLPTLCSAFRVLQNIVDIAIPFAAALALLVFFWGLAIYLLNFGEGKEDKQKQGRNLMIYGVVVIFVIVSIFGIVQLLGATFGVGTTPGGIVPGFLN